MSLIRKHVAVLQAWACLDLVTLRRGLANSFSPIIISSLFTTFPLSKRWWYLRRRCWTKMAQQQQPKRSEYDESPNDDSLMTSYSRAWPLNPAWPLAPAWPLIWRTRDGDADGCDDWSVEDVTWTCWMLLLLTLMLLLAVCMSSTLGNLATRPISIVLTISIVFKF